jgi:hypothetical protein
VHEFCPFFYAGRAVCALGAVALEFLAGGSGGLAYFNYTPKTARQTTFSENGPVWGRISKIFLPQTQVIIGPKSFPRFFTN